MAAVRFKIDENLPWAVRDVLRAAGHDACTVRDQALTGKSDGEIAARCQAEDRVQITLDTDFSSILTFPPDLSPGIIVIRTTDQAKANILVAITHILQALQTEPIVHKLWIVDGPRIRIRGTA